MMICCGMTVKGIGMLRVRGADDMLWNDGERDRNVKSERGEEDEGTDCEEGDSDTD